MIDPTSSHRKSIPRLPFHLSILNKPLTSLIHTDTQLFTMIIDSLKQYEPFSIPFLHKVSKRDVPNYYDHVKSPMDLGTLLRNVKKYDKRSFKKDLDLIWDNCVFFNGPSIYTDYAEKMRERANYLYNYLFTKEVKVKTSEDPNYFMESVNLCEEIINEDVELDIVDFKYQKLMDLGHFSKRIRYDMDVKLGKYESRRVLEQVIVVLIGTMGFKCVDSGAVRIFADVVYNLMFKQCTKGRGKITSEMKSLKLKDLEIIRLPESHNSSRESEDTKADENKIDEEMSDNIINEENQNNSNDQSLIVSYEDELKDQDSG